MVLNNEAAAALADLYDVNKDGKISLDEFSARMAGTLGSSLGANTLHQRTCATCARCFDAWHWHLTSTRFLSELSASRTMVRPGSAKRPASAARPTTAGPGGRTQVSTKTRVRPQSAFGTRRSEVATFGDNGAVRITRTEMGDGDASFDARDDFSAESESDEWATRSARPMTSSVRPATAGPSRRPQSAVSVLSTSVQSAIGRTEEHVSQALDKRWKQAFARFRFFDKARYVHCVWHGGPRGWPIHGVWCTQVTTGADPRIQRGSTGLWVTTGKQRAPSCDGQVQARRENQLCRVHAQRKTTGAASSGEMHLTRNASADRAPPKSASNTDVTSTVGTTLTHTLFKPSYQWDGMDGPHNSGPPPVRRILAVSDHVACATRCT